MRKFLENGYIYFIKCNEYYKIGCTVELWHRLCEIQVSNPYELELIFSFKITDAYTIEGLLHILFKEFHVRGEWFKLPIEVIDKITALNLTELETLLNDLKYKFTANNGNLNIRDIRKFGRSI